MWPSASSSSSRRRSAVDVLAAQLRAHLRARLLGGEQRLELLQRQRRAGLSGASPRAGARPRPRCRGGARPTGAPAPRAAGRSPRSSGSSAGVVPTRRATSPIRRLPRRWSAALRCALISELAASDGDAARRRRRSGRIAPSTIAASTGARLASAASRLVGRGAGAAGTRPRRPARSPASTHSATCMLAMNGVELLARERPCGEAGEDREQRRFRHRRGDDRQHERDRQHGAGVLQQRARAGGDAAPVGGHEPIIAAVLGLLNMPEPTPTTSSHSAALPVGGVHAERRHRGQPGGADEHPDRGERARAVAVGVDAGDRRGDQHAERQRDQLDAGLIGESPCAPWK